MQAPGISLLILAVAKGTTQTREKPLQLRHNDYRAVQLA
jgi:hypothetical protein